MCVLLYVEFLCQGERLVLLFRHKIHWNRVTLLLINHREMWNLMCNLFHGDCKSSIYFFLFTGKHLLCHPGNKPVDLKVLCTKLRAGPAAKHHCSQRDSISDKENAALASWSNVPDSAFDILRKLLDMNPYTRISADQALQHEFFSNLSWWKQWQLSLSLMLYLWLSEVCSSN